jgi:hypothetical protein
MTLGQVVAAARDAVAEVIQGEGAAPTDDLVAPE